MITSAFDVVADRRGPVLKLLGEFDGDEVIRFREALARWTTLEPPRTLIIDLTDVQYMGSRGLGELIRARERLPHVVLKGVQPQVLRLLEVTHLAGVFELADGAATPR